MKFCSACGGPIAFGPVAGETRHRHACPNCGAIFYQNPKIVVATLPTHAGGVVLIRRGIEPGYGRWGYPGGFLELGESAEEGAIRETLEETGYEIAIDGCVGIYSRPPGGVVVLVFAAHVTSGEPQTSEETLEVRSFPTDEIPWDDLAFPTVDFALRDWLGGVLGPAPTTVPGLFPATLVPVEGDALPEG